MTDITRIIQMQQQGMSDSDIVSALRNEGVSPKEISDSLAQAKIKIAVNQEPNYAPSYQESYSSAPQETQYAEPQPQQQYQQEYAPQPQYTEYSGQQQYIDQNQQQYSYDQGQMSVETISEIVERILSEKLKEINMKVKQTSDFKIRAEEDLRDLKERLKRIESNIDTLQRTIIGKVGEFGQSTTLIHKDLENLHGTVSKLMNPLVDNYNEMKKINSRN